MREQPAGSSIEPFTLDRYDAALALWREAEGVVLRDADRRERIAAYLARNPGLSFVALAEGGLAGTVLCGHDGRRGYLHHLAVAPAHRRRGIGLALVERCLAALAADGIGKCHLFVQADNAGAIAFWERLGWQHRPDVDMMSITLAGPEA